MSPSGHFFLAGVKPANVANSLDMHVIRMTDGADVFDRINGGFDYLEIVLPDDTCIYQDTTRAARATASPGVQTLYWTALPMTGTTTTATAINTRTASLTPSGDNKQLLYLKTSGDLYSWDASAKSGAGTKIASSVVKFIVGDGAVAFIAADGSVHVRRLDGATKMLDTRRLVGHVVVRAARARVGQRRRLLLPERRFDDWRRPEQHGHAHARGGERRATPSKVADKVSIAGPPGVRQRHRLPAEPRRSAGDRRAVRRRGDGQA